jgi:hypothetical protein
LFTAIKCNSKHGLWIIKLCLVWFTRQLFLHLQLPCHPYTGLFSTHCHFCSRCRTTMPVAKNRRQFKKRTIKCPFPGCRRLVVSIGGLTQHTQASHSAARQHPPRPPSPQPLDPKPGPFDRYLQDDAAREEDLNYENPRQQPKQGCHLATVELSQIFTRSLTVQ